MINIAVRTGKHSKGRTMPKAKRTKNQMLHDKWAKVNAKGKQGE